MLGTKGPRKMRVIVPVVRDGVRAAYKPSATEPSLVAKYQSNLMDGIVSLSNRAPKWNDSSRVLGEFDRSALGAYCLNFNGRVTVASVKNFQLSVDNEGDGKV